MSVFSDHQIPPPPPPPPPLMPSGQMAFISTHTAAMATPLHPAAAPGCQGNSLDFSPVCFISDVWTVKHLFSSPGGAVALSRPYSPSPPPPPPANYVPSPSRSAGQAPPSAVAAPPLPPTTDSRKLPGGPNVPMNDARSDLLAAIRRGQLVC